MQLNITDINKIKYRLRRGMLELDLLLQPFFESRYQNLSDKQKHCFLEFIAENDQQLFNHLMKNEPSDRDEINMIIKLIKDFHANRL